MTGKLFGAALVAAWGLAGWGIGQAVAQDSSEQQADASSEHDAARQNQAPTNDANSNRNASDRQSNDERDQRQSGERRSEQRQSNDRQQAWNSDDQASNRSDSRRGREDRDWKSQIRFGDQSQQGLAIANVEQGTPFYRGGLRQGDVIVSWNGQQVRSQDDFGRWADRRSGQRVPVIVLRDGRRETIYITYDQDRNRQSYEGAQSYAQQSNDSQAFLGVRFETRIRDGAVISDVVAGSPAAEAGLKAGDELVAINGREVNSGREVTRIVSSMQPGDRLDIEFSRRVENRTQAVLEGRPGDVASARYDRSSDWNRQGGQYDGIEQSSYDEQSTTGAAIDYGQGTNDRNYERRSGRTLLPRLRN